MAFGLENKMSSGIDINNYKSYWSAHSLNTDFIFFQINDCLMIASHSASVFTSEMSLYPGKKYT